MSTQSWNPQGPVMAWMLPVALLLVAVTQVYSAEPPSGQEARKIVPSKPDVKIVKWISQLDNDEFKVRERSTQSLIKAGVKALPAVLKATQSKQPEIRSRAFTILFAMSKSDDQATANAVLAAAKEILKSPNRQRVAQAKKILKEIYEREIQGKWIVVASYHKGKKVDQAVGDVITFSGKELTSVSKGESEKNKLTFELRPDKKPRELDLSLSEGLDITMKAIYDISGDTLRLCLMESITVRPAAMGTAADDNRRMLVLKRVKRDKGKDKK